MATYFYTNVDCVRERVASMRSRIPQTEQWIEPLVGDEVEI